MEVRNLDDDNLNKLETFVKDIQKVNPDIQYEIFNQNAEGKPVEKTVHQRLDEMAEVLADLQIKIDSIFSNHVLIDGKFIDTKKLI